MMARRLWREGPSCRISECSPFGLVVSQLVWVWIVGRKPNNYKANSSLLTIEWE